jgi:UDP-2-acetamido-2,6-beta-L-arabino-hexul-4-ose reductase
MSIVVVTGAHGFIGRNLVLRLGELGHEVRAIGRDDEAALADSVRGADVIVHLAGVNRPQDPVEFVSGNTGFTTTLVEALVASQSNAPIIYASSTQATVDNPYGASKRASEDVLLAYGQRTGAAVHIFRLPNVFGKWARPNYNSAVATFCHNIARGQSITVNDPSARLRLVYVDDVVAQFVDVMGNSAAPGFVEVAQVYDTTVGEVAEAIRAFPDSRDTLISPRVGTGLVRALYATYLTYLAPRDFAYAVPIHGDPRGVFVEMLKTPDAGQFSYFTAKAGITRGDHYHHTKAEKFLVIAGTAHFGFRQIASGETHELVVHGGEGRIVETIPGWTHNITNTGNDDLIVMLWANEIFDRARPDTIAMKV